MHRLQEKAYDSPQIQIEKSINIFCLIGHIIGLKRSLGEFLVGIENQGTSFLVKRQFRRFALIAKVEVTELNTNVRTHGQVSEISRLGCFIDILNTLPVGTPVKIVISRDEVTFSTQGEIIYKEEGKGMGVGFRHALAEQQAILDAWLGASASLCFFTPDAGGATQ